MVDLLPNIEERDSIFPFVTVSPQTGYRGYGWDPKRVKQLVDSIISEYGDNIDTQRLYLTGVILLALLRHIQNINFLLGISMGGYGTWATAAEFPDLFAAIIPVSYHFITLTLFL